MNDYRVLKLIIDEDDGEISFEDVMRLCKLSPDETEACIKSLKKKQLIYEEATHYFLTEKGRVTFASHFSKQMMLLLIGISLIIATLFYLYHWIH